MCKSAVKNISIEQKEEILATLKKRFEKNKKRHVGIEWAQVAEKLEAKQDKLWSLFEMERTEGEPDLIALDRKTGEFLFYDCSPESPSGRRSVCYDREALESRKKFKPAKSAMDMANEMGVEILNEEEYRALQKLGKFDSKTSSWLKTPDPIRKLGGAIFADFRFDHIFVYHNGAESYYGGRGFRSSLRV
jgi:predicted type IV restriction endonuclease